MINEGGPGSGPQGGGSSSDSKPKVLAHWDYKGPQYTSGVKLPKPSSTTYRQVWKGEAKEKATVSNGPIVMSTYPLGKSGVLLTYPPQKTTEAMGSSISLGGKLSQSYPQSSHAQMEAGSPISIGGVLSPSYPHSPTEAGSGSMFPGVER